MSMPGSSGSQKRVLVGVTDGCEMPGEGTEPGSFGLGGAESYCIA